MSIKTKLSFSISIIVAITLALSIVIYYFSTENELQSRLENQVDLIAKQVGYTIESSESSAKFMEDTLAEKLRIAAISVKIQLDPDINSVTNEQLVALSAQLGVEGISLWRKEGDDIVIRRSSLPEELGSSSMTWDYWYTAFTQLFEKHEVTIEQGQKLENFWSGPINFATSDPYAIRKWGNYYDGTTNYMINPFINAKSRQSFNLTEVTDQLIGKLVSDHEGLLEITGFDPEFFGQKPIIKIKKGIAVNNLDVRQITFGTYTYRDETSDSEVIAQAIESNSTVTVKTTVQGKEVIKAFIPFSLNKPYVIGVTFDNAIIDEPLRKQLLLQTIISIVLMLATMFISYFIADFMLRGLNQIFRKVNAIAEGDFSEMITIRSEDELGLLASRVDTMGSNLHSYTSQLKDTAEELRSTKQYLESLFNHTSDAIHVTDLSGRVIQVNKAFEKIYGWSSESILGKPLDHIPYGLESEYHELEATVLRGGSVTDVETVRHTQGGEQIDVSMTMSPIRDELGAIIAIASISRNITSRKQTEEMIRRSEKLAVVGQIAAGVAHEVRNPLTTLRGFVQLQKQQGTLNASHLDIMLGELDQINMIVSEFLVFAKPQASKQQPVQLESLIRDILMLLESEAKLNNVQFRTELEQNLPSVTGETSQLKQVFVNIVKNGMEAMPKGGLLDIKLAFDPDSQMLELQFSDQGVGISKEDLQRLGEPFFTRKDNGNGLGLMVSQQIIDAHRGTILFSSELGQGTSVHIRLPQSEPDR